MHDGRTEVKKSAWRAKSNEGVKTTQTELAGRNREAGTAVRGSFKERWGDERL